MRVCVCCVNTGKEKKRDTFTCEKKAGSLFHFFFTAGLSASNQTLNPKTFKKHKIQTKDSVFLNIVSVLMHT